MGYKFAVIAIGLALAGCNASSADQRTLGGAAIGAAVGGVTGAVIGRATTPNNCIYRDRYGRTFEARCP